MKRIFNSLNNLRMLSGNSQLAQLQLVKSDLLKDILEYTYNPHKKYKLDEKLNKFTITLGDRVFDEKSWELFKNILNYLIDKPSANDDEVKHTVEFISRFDEQGQEFCKQVLTKDLRLNMGVKKFQKVWADFCVEPQVQLAQAKENRAEFLNPFYSRKFDGKRMYIMDGVPFSRTNKQCSIEPVKHILEQIQDIEEIRNYFVLDGECLYFENGKENFQKGISLCQRDERLFGCDNICYVIFDMIPKKNFLSKTPFEKFESEYDRLINLLADETQQSPDYSLISTKLHNVYIARQDKDKSKLAQLCTENNWEGLMLRDGNSPYEYKRTNKLLKIKSMEDMELKLVGMEEGTGKHEGRLGAFICEYQNNVVKVGSGFSDELRDEYWNNQDKYIGKMVKVQYFEKTINQDGQPSLRFPVFISFRNLETMEEFMRI